MLLEKGATFIKGCLRGIMASNAQVRGREISNIVLSSAGAKVGMAIERANEDVLDLMGMWSGAIDSERAVGGWAIGAVPVGAVRVIARGFKGSSILQLKTKGVRLPMSLGAIRVSVSFIDGADDASRIKERTRPS
jgi:hypothetical protein